LEKIMCGIIGFLDKRGGQQNPIGKTLLGMLQALSCRGPDSAGVAVYGSCPPTDWHLRLSAPPGSDSEAFIAVLRELGVAVFRDYGNGVYDALVSRETDIATLEQRIQLQLPGTEVICFGKQLNLFKQVGSPEKLQATYAISEFTGSHGIGHTRLSTESRVDLSHSQPFWAHGVPDLATVHNGHITNYHKLRRQYEQRGYRFYTENDSEVIGVYLREQMEAGMSLEEALRSSLDDFDGSFCYLAATVDCLAFVKDRYGFKPLIVAETEDYVAIATEEIALHQALGRDFLAIAGEEIGLPDGFDSEFKAREPPPGTVGLWHIKQTAFAES
jgi:glutamate synthase domain-containing protein 1